MFKMPSEARRSTHLDSQLSEDWSRRKENLNLSDITKACLTKKELSRAESGLWSGGKPVSGAKMPQVNQKSGRDRGSARGDECIRTCLSSTWARTSVRTDIRSLL